MPTGPLQSVSLLAPGFMGLNTQDTRVGLSSGYATRANNLIIDKGGRLASREGHKVLNEPNADLGENYIESIWRHDILDGRSFYLCAGNNKLFEGKDNALLELTDITPAGLTIDGNRWQMQSLPEGAGSNARIYTIATQKDNPALAYSVAGVSSSWTEITDIPIGVTTFDPDTCLSAYGRIWTGGVSENPFTIFYSDLLDPTNFNSDNAGVLDISSVVGNNDTIVGLAQHNNFLIVFCNDNIVIYKGAENPETMSLEDVITGIGCLSRDSIKATGTDLIFLSKSGVRSLSRTIQEKSMPMRELTLNIRDEVTGWLKYETYPENIRAGYCEDDAFYIITLPLNRKMVYIDLRMPMENGSARCTTWALNNGNLFNSFFDDNKTTQFLMGVKGGISKYDGHTDNGESYDITYRSAASDLGGEGQTIKKMAKRATLTIEGAKQQDFTMSYGYDYTRNPRKVVLDRDLGTGIYPKYSAPTSLYGVTRYASSNIGVHRIKIPLGGSGESFYFGLDATILDELMSIQKIDVFLKTGKTS